MTKKLFRGLVLGITVFSLAVLAGYGSYVFTYRRHSKAADDIISGTASAETADDKAESVPATGDTEYYVARLENNDISIFLCKNGKEEFLYSLGINRRDLSEEDIIQLNNGIVLKDKQRLAVFEEDFTG